MWRSRKLQFLLGALCMVGFCFAAMVYLQPNVRQYYRESLKYGYQSPLSADGVPELRLPEVSVPEPRPLTCPPPPPPLFLGDAARDARDSSRDATPLQRVYVITPTYPRAVQVPEMTRLAQTLMLARNVFWVVTEDSEKLTPGVSEILERSGVPYVHILGLKPEKFRNNFKGQVPRGVSNRMAAIEWLRKNAKTGVFYFADDDNSYDFRLFEELAKTRRASAVPVGLVTHYGLSTPIVQDGVITAFYDGWLGGRAFPMDMAGFAVTVEVLLQHPKAAMPFVAGYEEDGFLKSLGLKSYKELEPLADNCTKIMVWHTQTKQPKVPFAKIDVVKYRNTNLAVLRHVVN